MDEETVPKEGALEYDMDEGVEDVPDEEDAGFWAAGAWESA